MLQILTDSYHYRYADLLKPLPPGTIIQTIHELSDGMLWGNICVKGHDGYWRKAYAHVGSTSVGIGMVTKYVSSATVARMIRYKDCVSFTIAIPAPQEYPA